MREIKIKDIKLQKLLQERNKIVLAGRKESQKAEDMAKEIEKIEKSLNKKGLELQKIDGQAKAILDKKNIELTIDKKNHVYEGIETLGLRNGSIVVTIVDRMSEHFDKLVNLERKELDKAPLKEKKVK